MSRDLVTSFFVACRRGHTMWKRDWSSEVCSPELMGIGPIPATKRVLEQTGLTLDDVGLFELNEPFAVQVLTWCEGMGIDPEDERLNPYGGAIACGHPLAATGVRLMAQLAYGFKERPLVRYGLTALCVGMGMGAAVLWENLGAGH